MSDAAVDVESNGRLARLTTYLSDLFGDAVTVVSFEQIEGGFSRHTYRVKLEHCAGTSETLAIRAEAGPGVLDTDLLREYRVVQVLSDMHFCLPRVLGFEETGRVIGQRFITTAWSNGEAVNPWRSRERGESNDLEQLCQSWIDDIADLHTLDVEPMYRAGVDVGVDAHSYLTSQVDYWTSRIRSTEHPPGPLVEVACKWLEESIPAGGATALVHGDLRLGNMLVSGDQVMAFLDWEMAGVGDWRADIGYTLMPYHAGKLLAPVESSSNGLIHPRRFLEMYSASSGFEMSDAELTYFIVLGCVKMISILCTGIDSYMSRQSSDPRLAWLNIAVPGLVADAIGLIEGGLSW